MKAYFDTAVLVAASVADHPHHSQSLAALQKGRKHAKTLKARCPPINTLVLEGLARVRVSLSEDVTSNSARATRHPRPPCPPG
jgi:predicted nucleic acid-binding protein